MEHEISDGVGSMRMMNQSEFFHFLENEAEYPSVLIDEIKTWFESLESCGFQVGSLKDGLKITANISYDKDHPFTYLHMTSKGEILTGGLVEYFFFERAGINEDQFRSLMNRIAHAGKDIQVRFPPSSRKHTPIHVVFKVRSRPALLKDYSGTFDQLLQALIEIRDFLENAKAS